MAIAMRCSWEEMDQLRLNKILSSPDNWRNALNMLLGRATLLAIYKESNDLVASNRLNTFNVSVLTTNLFSLFVLRLNARYPHADNR